LPGGGSNRVSQDFQPVDAKLRLVAPLHHGGPCPLDPDLAGAVHRDFGDGIVIEQILHRCKLCAEQRERDIGIGDIPHPVTPEKSRSRRTKTLIRAP